MVASDSTFSKAKGNYDSQKRIEYLLTAVGESTASQRWQLCHDNNFILIRTCPHNPNHHAEELPYSCELRICPECARSDSARFNDIYSPIFDEMASNRSRGYRLRFLTLTWDYEVGVGGVPFVANGVGIGTYVDKEKLNQLVAADRAAFDRITHAARLIRRQLFRKDKNAGGIQTVEVGPTGHKLHLHMLVYCKWIDQSDLSERWKRLTGCDIVDIRDPLKGRNKDGSQKTVKDAVSEAVKYISKPQKNINETKDYVARKNAKKQASGVSHDLSVSYEEFIVRLHLMLKGRRRVQPFGVVYDYLDENDQTPLLTDTDKTHACPVCLGKLVDVYAYMYERMLEEQEDREATNLILKHANKFTIEKHHPPPEQLKLL